MRETLLTVSLFSMLLVGFGLESFAGETYIFVDGIPGAGIEKNHKAWLPLKHYSWSGNMPSLESVPSSGKRAVERVDMKELTFQMDMDHSFPKLALALANGVRIPGVVLHEFHPAVKVPLLEIRLWNARIVSVSLEGTQTSRPSVTVGLAYSKIEWTYNVMDKAGRPMGKVQEGWDLKK
jgi:type VI secretion system secreted protein Hcp